MMASDLEASMTQEFNWKEVNKFISCLTRTTFLLCFFFLFLFLFGWASFCVCEEERVIYYILCYFAWIEVKAKCSYVATTRSF